MMADNDLAGDKVLYKGHAVAAVAAVSQYVAEEALALIEVDYEVLPPVMTFKDAMRDDAPLLHEGLRDGGRDEAPGGDGSAVRGNVPSHIQLKRDDVEKGFEEADVIVERELTTEAVHQGYIEPFAATADWSEEGRLTIWTSTQGIFTVRTNTAAILGLPESVVKVVPMEIGGGFGGKGVGYLEPVAAVLSRKSGRPVKMVMTRQEVFEATGPASGSFMRCKIGATRDGRITAAQLYLIYEGGAYPGSSVGGGANSGLGPYRLDNMLVDGYDVVCNRPKTQAYRAPGHPQAQFAVETVIDELAEKLGMDPLDLRTLNAAREGDRAPNGVLHARFGCSEVEDAMKAHPHYTAPLGGPNRGRGVAVGYRFNGVGVGRPGRGRRAASRQHRRRGDRPRDGQGRRSEIHDLPGRGAGRAPELLRGADAGRGAAGHRLGAERGVLLQRGWHDGQLDLPRLPHADDAGPADDRHGDPRGDQPAAPLRYPGCRRGAHRPAAGGPGQRRPRGDRRQDDQAAHDPGRDPRGNDRRRWQVGGCGPPTEL
jgi:CO/xanthine dehydrogenase Mo-binding subunit